MGFLAVDGLARAEVPAQCARAWTAEWMVNVVAIQPQTYMNLSGEAV